MNTNKFKYELELYTAIDNEFEQSKFDQEIRQWKFDQEIDKIYTTKIFILVYTAQVKRSILVFLFGQILDVPKSMSLGGTFFWPRKQRHFFLKNLNSVIYILTLYIYSFCSEVYQYSETNI